MDYKLLCNEKVIATFENEADAEFFVDWKRNIEKRTDYRIEKENLIVRMQEYVEKHKKMLTDIKIDRIPVVINAFGGPGAGKSTACMDICQQLKKMGYNAEYVQEYAKELVYEQNFEMLNGSPENQFKVLQEQTRRLDRLYDQVEFIVTDSPVLLNTIYNQQLTPEYSELVKQLNSQYTNFSFFIERDAENFQQEGRIHNLKESIEKDNEIKTLLKDNDIYYGNYKHDTINKVVKNSITTYNRINNCTPINKLVMDDPLFKLNASDLQKAGDKKEEDVVPTPPPNKSQPNHSMIK